MASEDSSSLGLDLLALVDQVEEPKLQRAIHSFNAAVVGELTELGAYVQRLMEACEEAKKTCGLQVQTGIEPMRDLSQTAKTTNQTVMILSAEAHAYKGEMSKEVKVTVEALPRAVKDERATLMGAIAKFEERLKVDPSMVEARDKKGDEGPEARRALDMPSQKSEVPGTMSKSQGIIATKESKAQTSEQDPRLRATNQLNGANGDSPLGLRSIAAAAQRQVVAAPPAGAPTGPRAQLAKQDKRQHSPDLLPGSNKKNRTGIPQGDQASAQYRKNTRRVPRCNSCQHRMLACDGEATCVSCYENQLPCVYQACPRGRECKNWEACRKFHPDQSKQGEQREVRGLPG